jgi:hypothetical protein
MRTVIQSHDPGVWWYSPIRQPRVYTPAVTNPGDSGAALIEDSSDLVAGFAHERTEAGAQLEWSSWIWADAVFTALNVQPSQDQNRSHLMSILDSIRSWWKEEQKNWALFGTLPYLPDRVGVGRRSRAS